jgi:hypothetical protein
MIADESEDEVLAQHQAAPRWRARRFLTPARNGRELGDEEIDEVLDTPSGEQIKGMMRYTAAGTPEQAQDFLAQLAAPAHPSTPSPNPSGASCAGRVFRGSSPSCR